MRAFLQVTSTLYKMGIEARMLYLSSRMTKYNFNLRLDGSFIKTKFGFLPTFTDHTNFSREVWPYVKDEIVDHALYVLTPTLEVKSTGRSIMMIKQGDRIQSVGGEYFIFLGAAKVICSNTCCSLCIADTLFFPSHLQIIYPEGHEDLWSIHHVEQFAPLGALELAPVCYVWSPNDDATRCTKSDPAIGSIFVAVCIVALLPDLA